MAEKTIEQKIAALEKRIDGYDTTMIYWKRLLDRDPNDRLAAMKYYQAQSSVDSVRRSIEKLQKLQAMDKSISECEAINEFMDAWEARAIEYYTEAEGKIEEAHKAYRAALEAAGVARSFSPQSAEYKLYRKMKADFEASLKEFNNTSLAIYEAGINWKTTMESLIAGEKKRKKDHLMLRVQEVVGDITNADHLYLANDAEINGYVEGTKGRAEVETITAGGYNIQRLHFRMLVKPLNR
jgi:tetratricopeptide (TPR) repeat protein